MGGPHHPGHDHGPNPFDGSEVQLTALTARVTVAHRSQGRGVTSPRSAPTVPTPPETVLGIT